jgi:large subunit ribosomal protein LP2
MRHVAAALLSALGGGAIAEASLKHVLDSVGIEYDAEKAKKVVSELAGKDLEALIAEGSKKLATIPSGGGGGAATPAAAAGAPAAAAKEEKKVESEKEECDDDMGFGLFD